MIAKINEKNMPGASVSKAQENIHLSSGEKFYIPNIPYICLHAIYYRISYQMKYNLAKAEGHTALDNSRLAFLLE